MVIKENHIYSINLRKSKLFPEEQLEIEIEGTLFFEIANATVLQQMLGTVNEKEVIQLLGIKLEGLLEQLLETIESPNNLLSDPIPFLNIIRVEMREYLAKLGINYVEISPLKLFKETSVIVTTYD